MKEHIKKFPSIASADGHIIDEPFISEVVVPNSAPLLIRCTTAGKMLKVISGEVVIMDAPGMIDVDTENWAYITFTDSLLNESITTYRFYQGDTVHSHIEDEDEYTESLRCFITADKVKYYLVEHEGSDDFSNDNTEATIMTQGSFTIYNESFEEVADGFNPGRGIHLTMHCGGSN